MDTYGEAEASKVKTNLTPHDGAMISPKRQMPLIWQVWQDMGVI